MVMAKKRRRTGRPSKYETHVKPRLLEVAAWARDGLIDEQIAKNLGVAVSTFATYKNKFPELSEALKKGKDVVDIEVENALLKRALGYSYEEVTIERIVDTGQKKRHGGESELTQEEWEFAQKYFNGRCCYCGELTSDLTKDHVKPLKNDGTMTFDNVVPSCRSCNSSKKDKEMMSWYQSTDFYDKHRMQKIHEYLDFVIQLGGTLRQSKPDDQLVVTKRVVKHQVPDTTAQIFWLKNRKPNEWRDKQQTELTGKDGGAIEIQGGPDLSNLSDEELMNLEKLLEKTIEEPGS